MLAVNVEGTTALPPLRRTWDVASVAGVLAGKLGWAIVPLPSDSDVVLHSARPG
jgi:hypothetical protein